MKKILINDNWNFENKVVTIPHTPKLEDLNVSRNYQGVFEYTKHIDIPSDCQDRLNFLYFEGVMINCKIYINNKCVHKHFGGYLPFQVEVSKYKSFDLKVKVDNRDDCKTPPGKPTPGLDFLYYGGIYRNVYLISKPKTYITSDIELEEESNIRVIPYRQSENCYKLNTLVTLRNKDKANKNFTLKFNVKDDKKVIYTQDVKLMFDEEYISKQFDSEIKNIKEWNICDSTLYTFEYIILNNDKEIYTETLKYGFRELTVNDKGYFVNGKKVKLCGLNRHQQYPYVGIAVSDNAHRREARLMHEANVNILRLAHYPQSPAFLDECDKLGILVIDCVPGWQFIGGWTWKKRLTENVKEMVKRDRNHACIGMFEVSPNESHWDKKRGDDFYIKLKREAKKYLPNCLVSGDSSGRLDSVRVGFDIPYGGPDKRFENDEEYRKNYHKMTLSREYGDWGFGGNNSTSRKDREDSEFEQLLQAWNVQWTRNSNWNKKTIMGDLYWEGVDHNRGYFPEKPISKSGVCDIFRLKKPSFYFIQSQTRLNKMCVKLSILNIENKKRIAVYSNCDEVELYIDGKLIEKRNPDDKPTIPYDESKGVILDNYWATNQDHIQTSNQACPLAKHTANMMFDGGNCLNLDYPPFTFNFDTEIKNEVKAIGYVDGKAICEDVVKKVGKPAKLAIELIDNDIKLENNDNDFVFAHISILDKEGNVVLDSKDEITINVEGGSVIKTNVMPTRAGIASFMVTKNQDKLVINATNKKGDLKAKLEY